MRNEILNRIQFLMRLAIDYNENHTVTHAVFRLDKNTVDLYVEDESGRDLVFHYAKFADLTEEMVYKIYSEVKTIKEETDTEDNNDAQ